MAGSLTGLVGLGSLSRLPGYLQGNLEIIDCHTHFYDVNRPEGVPWPEKGTNLYRTVLPKDLRAQKMYRPVTGTIIVEASSRIEDNQWLLDLAKDDPFVVGIVGRLEPGSPDFASQLKRFKANPLFRGIRVSVDLVTGLLEKANFADLKLLADADLALDVNGGQVTPIILSKLAKKVPGLRIVLNHIGNVRISSDPPHFDWVKGIQNAGLQKNVFCKISALCGAASRDGAKPPSDMAFYKPYLDLVWNAFGEDRVIYGSDWPVSGLAGDYETQQRIVMEYAATKGPTPTIKFCSVNAKKAYKWVDRPGRR